MTLRHRFRIIPPGPRSGFTMIELMISIMMLAIISTASLSVLISMQRVSESIAEAEIADRIATSLIERIQGANWAELGREPWSWHRREDWLTSGLPSLVQVSRQGTGENEVITIDYDSVTAGLDPALDFVHPPLIDLNSTVTLSSFLDDHGRTMQELIGTGESDSNSVDRFGLPVLAADFPDEYNQSIEDVAPALDLSTIDSETGPELIQRYRTPARYHWLQGLGLLDQPSGLRDLAVFVEYYRDTALVAMTSTQSWNTPANRNSSRLISSHELMNLSDMPSMNNRALIVRIVVRWTSVTGGERRLSVTTARTR